MLISILISVSMFLSGCVNANEQRSSLDPCEVVEATFRHEDINSILGLDVAEAVRPSIRVFDLTGKFQDCSSMYKSRHLDFPIPYHVEESISPTINTGTYRDLVIHRFSFDEAAKTGDIVLSAATFQTHNNVNTNFRIALLLEIDGSNSVRFIDTKITEYIDQPPQYDYDR